MAQSIETQGDLVVGRNVSVGGRMVVQGDATYNHNLNVKGWLDAPNVKGTNKGIFVSSAALNAAYQSPKPGWYAGVKTGSSVELYIESSGSWTDSGIAMEFNTDLSVLEELEEEISDKADKVSSATADNLAALDSNGNLKDSGKKKELLDILEIQTGFFKGKLPAGITVEEDVCPDKILPEKYIECIYYDSENVPQRFVCYNENNDKYYTRWNIGGEKAYVDRNGEIRGNKLYLDERGTICYYLDGELTTFNIDLRSKADRLIGGTTGNLLALTATGNYTDSGTKASDFMTKVNDATADDLAVLNNAGKVISSYLYGAGIAMATAVDAVELTVKVPQTGVYRLCAAGNDLWSVVNLVVIDDTMVLSQKPLTDLTVGFTAGTQHNIKYVFKNGASIPDKFFQGMDGTNGTLIIIGLKIPSYVTIIGASAFKYCSNLNHVICHALTPPSLTQPGDSFLGIDSGAILYRHRLASGLYGAANNPWNLTFPVASNQQKDQLEDYPY